MKEFWTEIKIHQGLFYGFLFPALGFFAGTTNKTIETATDSFIFGLICMTVMGVLVWTPILVTSYRIAKIKRKQKETHNPLLQFLDN